MTNPNDYISPSETTISFGLTKREYFAAMAMNGLMAALQKGRCDPKREAELAIRHADALIAELNKPNDKT